jgi:hypothetical protein
MLGVNHERKYYTQMRRFVSLARCQRLVVGIGVVSLEGDHHLVTLIAAILNSLQ